MIPKIIHYCWFGEKELSGMGKIVLLPGKNIYQIME